MRLLPTALLTLLSVFCTGQAAPPLSTLKYTQPSTVPMPPRPILVTLKDWRTHNYGLFLGQAKNTWETCGMKAAPWRWPDEVLFPSNRNDAFLVRQGDYSAYINIVQNRPVVMWCGAWKPDQLPPPDETTLLNYARKLKLNVTTTYGLLPDDHAQFHRYALENGQYTSAVITRDGQKVCSRAMRAPDHATGPIITDTPVCYLHTEVVPTSAP